MSCLRFPKALLVVAALFSLPTQAAIVISLDPAKIEVTSGTSFFIDINISGLLGQTVTEWDAELAFDNSLLDLVDTEFTDQLGNSPGSVVSAGTEPSSGDSPLRLSQKGEAPYPNQPDDGFTLVKVELEGVVGLTEPVETEVRLTDSAATLTQTGAPAAGFASIAQANIPEPGSLMILLSGIGLLLWRRNRDA